MYIYIYIYICIFRPGRTLVFKGRNPPRQREVPEFLDPGTPPNITPATRSRRRSFQEGCGRASLQWREPTPYKNMTRVYGRFP